MLDWQSAAPLMQVKAISLRGDTSVIVSAFSSKTAGGFLLFLFCFGVVGSRCCCFGVVVCFFFSFFPPSGANWHRLPRHGLSRHHHHDSWPQRIQHPPPDPAEALQQPGRAPDQGPRLEDAGPQAETGQVSRVKLNSLGGVCQRGPKNAPQSWVTAAVPTGWWEWSHRGWAPWQCWGWSEYGWTWVYIHAAEKNKNKSPFVLLQVPKLFCYEIESHRCDPGSLGSPEFPRRQPEHAGGSSGRNGKTRNRGFSGSRRKLLMQPWREQEGQTQGAVKPCYCKRKLKWKPRPMSYTRDISEKKASKQTEKKYTALTFTCALLVHYHRI